MNTFNLTLDLDKEQGLPQLVTLRQGDKSGTQLVATIYDHGQLVSGGYTARVSLRHPGSGKTYYRETATYSNGVATVTVNEQYAATVAGVTTGYFELLQGSTVKASTADFIVRILPSAEDGAVPGEVYDSAIEDALDELDAATGRISQMVVDATAEYLAAHPEITTTVQDNSVTDAKLIQSGGVLDRVGRLWWRLENLLTNTPAESESVTVSDAAKTPVAGLTVFGKSTQDGTPTPDAPVAIESVQGNLLPTTTASVTTKGVTFTHNEDGTYTVKGTATGTIEFDFIPQSENVATLPAGTYALSGCPAGGSSSTWKMDIRVGAPSSTATGSYVTDYGGGATVTRQEEFAVNRARIVVYSGATIDATFKPALYEGLAPLHYVPYDSVGLLARGRNLARSHLTDTYTYNGITWTYAGDGTLSANGTTGSSTSSNQWTTYLLGVLPAGNYTVTMTPLSGTITGAGLAIAYRTGAGGQTAGRILGVSSGGRVTCTLTADGTSCYWLQPYIRENTTVTNLVLGMQVEVGSATAYVPYAESVTAIPLDGHTLRSLPDGTRDEVTVDQYGHVTLVQRVGEVELDGSNDEDWQALNKSFGGAAPNVKIAQTSAQVIQTRSNRFVPISADATWIGSSVGVGIANTTSRPIRIHNGDMTLAEWTAWLAANPVTVDYPLATPQTHDLGTIDPTALVGPDLTAQAVPTAPFALTYERDLNATLARLEAALATLA